MTDFSFYNKASDLLEQLKEDGIIHLKAEKHTTKDVKLALDIIKDVYPIYSSADDETLLDFIKDIFKVNLTKKELKEVNKPIDEYIYRLANITDIKPGNTFRLEGLCYSNPGTIEQKECPYYYMHTFPSREMSLVEYADAFEQIHKFVRNNKAQIKTTFIHRTEDVVRHVDDPNSIGIVKARRVLDKQQSGYEIINPNEYSIFWGNTSIDTPITFKRWEKESALINQTKEKEKIMSKEQPIRTKYHKLLARISYEKFNPQLIEDLKNEFKFTDELLKQQMPDAGWVYNERNIIIGTHKIVKDAALEYLLKDKDYDAAYPNFRKMKILWTTKITKSSKPTYKPKVHKVHKVRKIRKLKTISHRPIISEKLIPIKHTVTGYVSMVKESLAERLLSKENGTYINSSIPEYNECMNAIKKKKDEMRPGPTEMGTDLKSGMKFNRRTRRMDLHKVRRNSRLVKEQFVPVAKPAETVTMQSINPCINMYEYDEHGNEKITLEHFISTFVKPAKVFLKRILVRIQGSSTDTLTKEDKEERSKLDKAKYNIKKDYKSLQDLKEMFKEVERRNGHYSSIEKWSVTFDRLLELATTGRLIYSERNVDAQLKYKDIYKWFKIIISDETGFKWDDQKILDFMRYLRLTSRGVFNGKPQYSPRLTGKRSDKLNKKGEVIRKGKPYKKKAKKKLPNKPVQFEVVKSITKLDYSKLRYNTPDANKPIVIRFDDDYGQMEKEVVFKDSGMWDNDNFICSIKQVISWRYPDKEEFEDIIIDTGGGITQVPIKYRRSKIPF